MDVYTIINDLLDYAYWGALIFSIAAIFAGILGVALGNQRLRKFLVSGTLAIIIWAAIPTLASNLLKTQAPGSVEFFVIALGAFAFIYGVYNFAAGNYSKAAWLAVAGIIVVGVFSLPFFNTSYNSNTSYQVTASVNPQIGFAPLTTTLTINAPGVNSATYCINWGDGSTSTISGGSSVTASHTYNNAGGYGVIITVKSGNSTGETFVAVNVLSPPNIPWPFNSIVEGIESGLLGIANFLNAPFDFFWTVPQFPTSGQLWNLYEIILSVSFGAFGLFVVLNVFSNAVSDEDVGAALVKGFKEVILVALAMLIVPYLYNIIASFLNQVVVALIPFANPGALLLGAITIIGAGFGAGYFVPELADLGAALSIALLIATALSIIRMIVIYAGILLSPVFLAFSLFPATKGISRVALELTMGFILAGPFSAAIFAVLSIMAGQWGLAGNLGLEVASPFLLQVIPDLLGFGAAKGLMGGFGISAPKVRQNNSQGSSENQENQKVTTVPGSIGRTSSSANTQQNNTQQNQVVTVPVRGHEVKLNQQYGSGPMGIIRRVRNRGTGTVTREDIAGDDLGRKPYVPRGYKITEEKDEVAGLVHRREWQIKETRLHALGSGLKENYKAAAKELGKSLSVRFDALMEKYTGVKPIEAIRREVGDVKLRHNKRSSSKLK